MSWVTVILHRVYKKGKTHITLAQARAELAEAKPVPQKMRSGREKLEGSLETVEEDGVGKSSAKTKKVLAEALEQVGSGKPLGGLQFPSYPGLFTVWDYARDVRRTLLESLDQSVKLAEDEARTVTCAGVAQIKDLGEEHLPVWVERSRRVVIPEAMFSAYPTSLVADSPRLDTVPLLRHCTNQ
ncbi:hypothetical protein K438DRAFT_1780372 [Mycena galopus ATCC 62051]|nr:hypothetical protein K438DRAFT_1780372 [Mycena galopus ATCC 62051]